MYHSESKRIYSKISSSLNNLSGGTFFKLGDIEFEVNGKDGLGGLIEEWFGVWADKNGFIITNPKKNGHSQEFPDYYVGKDNSMLEIKTFDSTAGANFDIANFESYCQSVSQMPTRTNADYLIFSYKLESSKLSIEQVWLKKIWEITCPSARFPLKTQVKRGVIYNIRPASWFSTRGKYKPFQSKEEFINALFETQKIYLGKSFRDEYLDCLKNDSL